MGARKVHRRRGVQQDARNRRNRQHRLGGRRPRSGAQDEGDRVRSLHRARGGGAARHRARVSGRSLRPRGLRLRARSTHTGNARPRGRSGNRPHEARSTNRELCPGRHHRRSGAGRRDSFGARGGSGCGCLHARAARERQCAGRARRSRLYAASRCRDRRGANQRCHRYCRTSGRFSDTR